MIYIEIFNKFIEVSFLVSYDMCGNRLVCNDRQRAAADQQKVAFSSHSVSSDTTVLHKLLQPIITHQLLEVDSNWTRGRGAVRTVFPGVVAGRGNIEIGLCSSLEQ